MEKAKEIQKLVNEILEGNPVFLVGGSVRDLVLKLEPKDWDFCTPLDPDTVEALVKKSGRRAYGIGKRFGTIGFKVKYNGGWQFVEVTTYRKEVYNPNSRKPEVEFTDDLLADLSRRDFTINAMVLQDDGLIYDPFGGRIDILQKLIKSVGTPKDRISEDPLRMLRAARFASKLRFGLDPNYIGKMRQLGPSIAKVSKERWVEELDKVLIAREPMRGIKILMQSDLMKYMLPEVWYVLKDDETYQALNDFFDANPDATLNERWGALLSSIAEPYTWKDGKDGKVTFPNQDVVRREMIRGIISQERLKFSNDRKDFLLKM